MSDKFKNFDLDDFFKEHGNCFEVLFKEKDFRSKAITVVPMRATILTKFKIKTGHGSNFDQNKVRGFLPISKIQLLNRIEKHQYIKSNVVRNVTVHGSGSEFYHDDKNEKNLPAFPSLTINVGGHINLLNFDNLKVSRIVELVKKYSTLHYQTWLGTVHLGYGRYRKKVYSAKKLEYKLKAINKCDITDSCSGNSLTYKIGSYKKSQRKDRLVKQPITLRKVFRTSILCVLIGDLKRAFEKKIGGGDLIKYQKICSRTDCYSSIHDFLKALNSIKCKTHIKYKSWQTFCEYFYIVLDAECKLSGTTVQKLKKEKLYVHRISLLIAIEKLIGKDHLKKGKRKWQKLISTTRQTTSSGGSSKKKALQESKSAKAA